jgi:hypothetical protein
MSAVLKPGTICIVTRTPTGADMGRLVEVVRFEGPRQVGPKLLREAYLVRCVAGRPFHSVRRWLPDGGHIDLRDKVSATLADRSQLRALPGPEQCVDSGERVPEAART